MAYTLNLLTNGDATPDDYKVWNGDSTKGELVVSGTFDGASVGLQFEDKGSDVTVFDGASALVIDGTSKQSITLDIPYGQAVKPIISGAGASTSLNINIYGLDG